VLRIRACEGALQRAVHLRHDLEERRAHHAETVAHLVERGRSAVAHDVGEPEALDLRGDRRDAGLALARHEPAVLHAIQLARDRRELVEHRAPPRLARVRGEDGQDQRMLEDRLDLCRAHPALAQRAQGRLGRLGRQLRGGPLGAPAQHAHARALFRQIDQIEVQREDAGQQSQARQAQRLELLEQVAGGLQRALRAQLLRRHPHVLDEPQRRLALELEQRGVEQPREHGDVAVQIEVAAGRGRAGSAPQVERLLRR
jgi:hypothetical protein